MCSILRISDRLHSAALLALPVWLAGAAAFGHDIPNARVDRAIQAHLIPGRLTIDYEVALSELTMTRDLRALIGTLPGADRRAWVDRYGKETGPLNAKGLIVSVGGRRLKLRAIGFDLVVDDHLRYTFHFEADLPAEGRLTIRDTNYGAGEGTSRLAVRGSNGVVIRGDDLPDDVSRITPQPLWKLSDAEEERTRNLDVEFGPGGGASTSEAPRASVAPASKAVAPKTSGIAAERLSRLLDDSSASGLGLWLMALGLGAMHAVQPGHGKSLVAAASIGRGGGWRRGFALALVITVAHMGGVLAIAGALFATRSTRYPDVNRALAQGAGFVIAAIGVWRLGRHFGGHGEHADDPADPGVALGNRGLLGLGLAGGVVPCWDAVVLILLAEAVGRLALGVALLAAFSLGMASVLVAVGVTASHLRGVIERRDRDGVWQRRLGLLSAAMITAIGVYLMAG